MKGAWIGPWFVAVIRCSGALQLSVAVLATYCSLIAEFPFTMNQEPPTTDHQLPPMPSPLTYFTGLAQAYADHRPSYPMAAIEAILNGLPRSTRVADIGCGTGISTRLL